MYVAYSPLGLTFHVAATIWEPPGIPPFHRASTAAFPKASFAGMPRQYRGRADYLVLEKRHVQLQDASAQRSVALIVLEVKKQLSSSNMPQALLGFLTYGAYSNVALLYVSMLVIDGPRALQVLHTMLIDCQHAPWLVQLQVMTPWQQHITWQALQLQFIWKRLALASCTFGGHEDERKHLSTNSLHMLFCCFYCCHHRF